MRLLLLAPALLLATPAIAQDTGSPGPKGPETIDTGGDHVTIGVGGAYMPDYEGADHYGISAVPVAIGSVSGFNFQLIGNRFSADLIPNKPGPTWDLQAGPVAVLDLNRSVLSYIDDRRVRALGKRDRSLEVGGYVGIGKTGVITSQYDQLSVSVSYRKGVIGDQRGAIWSPTINYLTPLSRKAAVGLFASAEHADRKYGQAYFDVSAAGSAASGLPQFTTRGGWKSWTAGGFVTVALTGDLLHGFKLVAGGSYKRMLNDFADSPVVSIAGNRNQWLAGAGLAYTF
ncbi:MAG: MipA/OmpV family protein [Sphingomonas sp.]|uniref:MipA/OmpV family protein n=1 Tax=Sphingomonas sp. TaxID=28214 RepID=UPI003F7E4753